MLALAWALPGDLIPYGSADAHGTIEWAGALFALIAGFALITHFRALGNRLYLFIGLAFFVNGAEDFVHGVLSLAGEHQWLGVEGGSVERFIPGTYVTGRLLFGMLLVMAPFAPRLLGTSRSPTRETAWASCIVLLATIALTSVAFILPLPQFIYPRSIISRPIDFISGVVLAGAFIVFARQYHRRGEVICWWILLSIGVNIVGQLMMSFSKSLFDAPFNIAHVYKLLGYVVPLLGFCLYQVVVITERKRAEEELARHREHLEELVQVRTGDLEKANTELQRENAQRKLATKALRESQASLAKAQEIAHLGNWDWNIVTDELRWSDEIYRIFGLRPQEFGATYEAFSNYVHPDDRDLMRRSVEEALHQNKPYSMDHRILLPTGEVRVVHEEGEVTSDESGRPTRLVGTVQDVTELKRAEEELRYRMDELERFNRLAVGREERMIELKHEVNEMARKVSIAPPYDLAFAEPGKGASGDDA